MKVVTLEPPSHQGQGDHVYRTLEPSLALAACDGVMALGATWLSSLGRAAAEDADVLVLCQAVDADFLALMARRRAFGRITVVEFNDHFLAAPSHSPAAAFYADAANRSLALQLAGLADGVQFSTQALADTFGHLNARCAVFRNAVPLDVAPNNFKAPRCASAAEPLRLGWGGSKGHLDDLRWLMPALKLVVGAHSNIKLCIMGAPELLPLFAWVPKAQLEWRNSGSLAAYQSFVQSLDVGVAPLCATPFNDCRSDVKYVEYTLAGVAGVFSARPAYASTVLGETTGLLADSPAAFVAQIQRLLHNPALRRDIVHAAQAQIWQERRPQRAALARLGFWRSLGAENTARQAPKERLDWAHMLPAPARRGARAWVLPMTGADADLHDGLLLGSNQEARRHLERACRDAADNYLSWLYFAHVATDPKTKRRALDTARRLAPDAASVCLALGRHLFDIQMLVAAQEIVEAATTDTPDAYRFAPLVELLGRICLSRGDERGARRAFEDALRQNPWYRSPAIRLAQWHIDAKAPEVAQKLLETNRDMGLGHWLDAYLLGELAQAKQAWHEAKAHYQDARRLGAPAHKLCGQLAQACAQTGDARGALAALAWARASQPSQTSDKA